MSVAKAKRKAKHSVSDSTLMKLWRLAVLAKWDHEDPLYPYLHNGERWRDPSGDSLACHHVVLRRHYVLRWNVENGLPLTAESHQWAHTAAGAVKVWELVDSEYLEEMQGWLKPDWLRHIGMSDNEWRLEARDRLRVAIGEGV